MEVSNIIEEMNFLFGKEEGCCDRMDWCISPALEH